MTYPYLDNPLSPEEKLCQEAVYYLNMLARHRRNKEGVDDEEEENCEERETKTICSCCGGVVDLGTLHVALKELFRFPQVQQLSTSEDDIRLVRRS